MFVPLPQYNFVLKPNPSGPAIQCLAYLDCPTTIAYLDPRVDYYQSAVMRQAHSANECKFTSSQEELIRSITQLETTLGQNLFIDVVMLRRKLNGPS